jgi:hypothetical protein
MLIVGLRYLQHKYLPSHLVAIGYCIYILGRFSFRTVFGATPFPPGLGMAECDGRENNHVTHVASGELNRTLHGLDCLSVRSRVQTFLRTSQKSRKYIRSVCMSVSTGM